MARHNRNRISNGVLVVVTLTYVFATDLIFFQTPSEDEDAENGVFELKA